MDQSLIVDLLSARAKGATVIVDCLEYMKPPEKYLTAERRVQASLGGARQELGRSCGSVSRWADRLETTAKEISELESGATASTAACNESVAHAAHVASLWPWCKAVPLFSVCATALDSSRASVSDAANIAS